MKNTKTKLPRAPPLTKNYECNTNEKRGDKYWRVLRQQNQHKQDIEQKKQSETRQKDII